MQEHRRHIGVQFKYLVHTTGTMLRTQRAVAEILESTATDIYTTTIIEQTDGTSYKILATWHVEM